MIKVLYFSDYINPAAKRIRFLLLVCARFFIILFRWSKGIKPLHLDYSKKYLFENSYLIIRYRFRNALWYEFKNISKPTEKEIIVLNLRNVRKIPIQLIVYGFFRRKAFCIPVTVENRLQNKSFKTLISTTNKIELYNKRVLLKDLKPISTIPKAKINHREILLKQPSYNETDFL